MRGVSPTRGAKGVPGVVHRTVSPFPMSHRVSCKVAVAAAVAVTVYPPADALRVIGPVVIGPGSFSHKKLEKPMMPTPPGSSPGVEPGEGARMGIGNDESQL